MHFTLKTGLAVALLSAATAGQLYAQNNRFQGMDRNRDGVITRGEWRGNDHGVPQRGLERRRRALGRRSAARRPQAGVPPRRRPRLEQDGVINQQDALIGQRFNGYDRNGDGRITLDEWRAANADPGLFSRLDTNHDRTLTIAEYAASNGIDAQGGPRYQFANIDRNRDGWITRNEWNMGDADFTRLDANRDNRISQYEFQSYSKQRQHAVQPSRTAASRPWTRTATA